MLIAGINLIYTFAASKGVPCFVKETQKQAEIIPITTSKKTLGCMNLIRIMPA